MELPREVRAAHRWAAREVILRRRPSGILPELVLAFVDGARKTPGTGYKGVGFLGSTEEDRERARRAGEIYANDRKARLWT